MSVANEADTQWYDSGISVMPLVSEWSFEISNSGLSCF